VLGIAPENLRVLSYDVGGNFGTRNRVFVEFGLVLWAAKKLGRPVKFTATRAEAFLSDYQGRDLVTEVELALDQDGRMLAMRATNISNVGAHCVSLSPLSKGAGLIPGSYAIPAARLRALAVFTNTMPTQAYRSSGRPEVTYAIERLVDIAADELGDILGLDRIALRRKNLIPPNAMPYRNAVGMVYDSGDYIGVMKRTLELADWKGFPARKKEARTRGKYRGIGVANYVDTASGIPREKARVTVYPDGSAEVVIGTISNGQGHETSFAQLVNEWLGVPFDKVRLVTGDTNIVDVGGGAHSGRGMRLGSIVIWGASNRVIDKAKQVVGLLLQKNPGDVAFDDGAFSVSGEPVMRLAEVAEAMAIRTDLPEEFRGTLCAECDETVNVAGFPYGCHACEVEIDPDLGLVEIVRHTAVDDVGRAVNPLIIHGQTAGGIAQGVGQALLEHAFYDASTGQMLAGSFMDYAMPRADILPSFITDISEVPSTTHPLGIRPAGEGGITPALGVIINAVVDALSEFGVTHMEMPATPERIWRAIHGKQQRSRIVPDAAEQEISLL